MTKDKPRDSKIKDMIREVHLWSNNCGGCETCEQMFGKEELTYGAQDMMEFIDEYEALESKCAKLEAAVKVMDEVLEYYANTDNWYDINNKNIGPELRMIIGSIDTEGNNWIGGRNARLARAKAQEILKDEK